MWLYHRVISPNDADGMANSVDPDQTAPLGTVWSGSTLFAQAYLSENLGKLRYCSHIPVNWCQHLKSSVGGHHDLVDPYTVAVSRIISVAFATD